MNKITVIVIGKRGSGKSTVIELMREGLWKSKIDVLIPHPARHTTRRYVEPGATHQVTIIEVPGDE